MTEDDSPRSPDASNGNVDRRIHRRRVDPDPNDPYLEVLRPVAELEGCDVEELPPLYTYVDHLIENLFTTPPPEEAQVQLAFSYYNYRIELDQRGNMTLICQGEPIEFE